MKKFVIWFIVVIVITAGTLAWLSNPNFMGELWLKGKTAVTAGLFAKEQEKDEKPAEPVTVTMYTADGRKEEVPVTEVAERKSQEWYEEPLAHLTKENETKQVVASQVEDYRMDGWQFEKYCVGLSELSREIEDYIRSKSGIYGVYVKNLDTGDFLVLNDGQYNAASVIKLYQMAAIYDEIEKGNLAMDSDIENYLKQMITVSDNYSFNRLVSILGEGDYRKAFDMANEFVDSIGCINTQTESLFSGYGFFIAYGYNYVSPYDCGLTLEQIYRRTLVSPEYSDEMLSLLKQQTRQNKIPYYLPEEAICANKTGETSTIENDVGIVYSPNCDYIICVMTYRAPTGVSDIQKISEMTYRYFNP